MKTINPNIKGNTTMKQFLHRGIAAILASAALATTIVYSGACMKIFAQEESETKETTALKNSTTFNLNDVVITNDYFENAQELEHKYLLSFDIDRLLAGFRDTAGIDMKGATRYPGWESMLIGGHCVGHYLTACAQAYASLPDGDENKAKFYDILKEMTDGLRECQLATGTGFIFGAQILDRNNIEIQFDYVEKGQTNIITQAWVPWYTMHKILAGLVDVYKLTGYELAKTTASDLGDWCYGRTSSWSEDLRRSVLGIEYGGMNDCLYELYGITGKDEHAIAAHAFDETWLFESVRVNTENALNNRHANTTIPKFLGGLNRYVQCHGKTVNGEVVDADVYLEYAEAFFDMVVNKHTYITGGNSEWEHFGVDHVLDAERTNCNCETCNTYNMLKLARTLFMITGKVKYADYYETAYLNAIMSSQNPETGMTTYFQPMATGYFKVYGTEFTKFWCCTGSGMENFTKLSDSLYFKNGDAVVVNQYISSYVNWSEKNVTLTQTTDIPLTDTAKFTVTAGGGNADISVYFRLPDWLAGGVKITVDGAEYSYESDGGYALVKGPFKNGTEIEITLPMNVTVHSLPDNENAVAFKYGPVVLSALLGKDNMTKTTTGVDVTIPANKQINSTYAATASDKINILNGQSVDEFMANINDNLVRADVNGELAFTLKNTDADLVFVTHYTQHEERYGLYWIFVESGSDLNAVAHLAAKKSGWLETNLIDTVQPGYGQYENDELHEMKELGEGSVGTTSDGTSRYALAGGAFTYRMLVNDGGETSLLVYFRKEDNGKTVKITVGDDVVYEATLSYSGADSEYQVVVPIAGDVISKHAVDVEANGKSGKAVTLTFSGVDGAESARICTFLYSVRSYSDDVTLTVDADGAVEYDGSKVTVSLNEDASETTATFIPASSYGYIKLNGNIIDESRPQTVALDGKRTSITVTVYAEDQKTSKEYKVTFVTPGDGIRANVDENVAYFVDCGDHDPSTLSEGDLFGTHNSVTEQKYRTDAVTGYKWGVIDDKKDQYGGSAISKGVYTANTWCYENNGGDDGLPKEETNRYTKNQYENGIDRNLVYGFELENGTYSVTVGFADPWGCSNHPTLTANPDTDEETVIVKRLNLARGTTAEGEVTVKNGMLTLKFTSDDKAINVTFIKIVPISVDESSKTDPMETEAPDTEMPESEGTDPADTEPSDGDTHEKKISKGVIAAVAAAVAAVAAVGVAIFGKKKKK